MCGWLGRRRMSEWEVGGWVGGQALEGELQRAASCQCASRVGIPISPSTAQSVNSILANRFLYSGIICSMGIFVTRFFFWKNFKVVAVILDYALLCDSCQFPVSGSWNSNMTSRLRVLISARWPELDGWRKRMTGGWRKEGWMGGWMDRQTDGHINHWREVKEEQKASSVPVWSISVPYTGNK